MNLHTCPRRYPSWSNEAPSSTQLSRHFLKGGPRRAVARGDVYVPSRRARQPGSGEEAGGGITLLVTLEVLGLEHRAVTAIVVVKPGLLNWVIRTSNYLSSQSSL